MNIYQVTYSRIDWDLYFCGYAQYHYTARKLFQTRERAEEFVADGLYEWVPTYKKNVCVKNPGDGKIEEIPVE